MEPEKSNFSTRRVSKRLQMKDPAYKEAWAEYHRAKGSLANAERALNVAALNAPEIKPIKALEHGDSLSIRETSQSYVTVAFVVLDEEIAPHPPRAKAPAKPEEPAKPAPFRVPHHVDEKTVRMLLNGSLITEAQKKKLVGGMIPGLLDEEPEKES